jgi:hypothetical protein
MSHIRTLKSTPKCFDRHLIIIRVCIPLHTRHHVKQMHVMLPHYHITTYEDSPVSVAARSKA